MADVLDCGCGWMQEVVGILLVAVADCPELEGEIDRSGCRWHLRLNCWYWQPSMFDAAHSPRQKHPMGCS